MGGFIEVILINAGASMIKYAAYGSLGVAALFNISYAFKK